MKIQRKMFFFALSILGQLTRKLLQDSKSRSRWKWDIWFRDTPLLQVQIVTVEMFLELITLRERLGSPPVFCGILVGFLVFCVKELRNVI